MLTCVLKFVVAPQSRSNITADAFPVGSGTTWRIIVPHKPATISRYSLNAL